MRDHDPRHQSQMLLSSQLNPFFSELAEKYQGKTVYLYPGSHLEHTPGDAAPATLTGITFEHHRKKDLLTIHTAVGGNPQETTVYVNLVWVIRDEDGSLIALEVIDKKDKKLVLEIAEEN
jgi:hypothetical protein